MLSEARVFSSLEGFAGHPYLLILCWVADDLVCGMARPVPAVVALLTLLSDIEEPAVALRTDAAFTAAH